MQLQFEAQSMEQHATDSSKRLFALEGQVGIVTGASRGIGYAIAQVLRDAGAVVYDLSRHVVADHDGTNCIYGISCDVSDEEQFARVLQQIVQSHGKLNFLVNNAGVSYKERAENFPLEQYRRIAKVDLEAPFRLCQLCYPYLKQSCGAVVNITSMGAYMGFSGVAPYCAMKSGLSGLTRALAEEWSAEGIRVNSVSPGWVETEMNHHMFEQNPQRRQQALAKSMTGKFVHPEDIGCAVQFLLSAAARSITGQDISVDGGARSHGY